MTRVQHSRSYSPPFLTRRPGLFTIPMTASASHAKDNAAAAEIELRADEIARLNDAFPLGAPRTGVPTL